MSESRSSWNHLLRYVRRGGTSPASSSAPPNTFASISSASSTSSSSSSSGSSNSPPLPQPSAPLSFNPQQQQQNMPPPNVPLGSPYLLDYQDPFTSDQKYDNRVSSISGSPDNHLGDLSHPRDNYVFEQRARRQERKHRDEPNEYDEQMLLEGYTESPAPVWSDDKYRIEAQGEGGEAYHKIDETKSKLMLVIEDAQATLNKMGTFSPDSAMFF
jgi:hypothetical protein